LEEPGSLIAAAVQPLLAEQPGGAEQSETEQDAERSVATS
jgi:hypothetical protein